MENLNKEYKLVFNAGVARRLLKANCIIADVKPDRENPVKSIFVFKRDDNFEKAFSEINKELAGVKVAE